MSDSTAVLVLLAMFAVAELVLVLPRWRIPRGPWRIAPAVDETGDVAVMATSAEGRPIVIATVYADACDAHEVARRLIVANGRREG